jgi:hypothetical protein
VDDAKHATRVVPSEVVPKAEEELHQVRVAAEVGPEGGDGAVVVGPERAGVAWAELVAARRVLERTVTWFHAVSLPGGASPTIGGAAASCCG